MRLQCPIHFNSDPPIPTPWPYKEGAQLRQLGAPPRSLPSLLIDLSPINWLLCAHCSNERRASSTTDPMGPFRTALSLSTAANAGRIAWTEAANTRRTVSSSTKPFAALLATVSFDSSFFFFFT